MDTIIVINRYLHIIVGFVGLIAWWVPALTVKGGTTHRRFGRIFILSAFVVGITAMLSAPLRMGTALAEGQDPMRVLQNGGFLVFLGYLGILTLNFAYFGLRVLRTRRQPETIATPLLAALTWTMMIWSVVAAVYALAFWSTASIIMLLLAPPGIMQGLEQRRYMAARPSVSKPWFYAHLDAMVGAGIAFHTAFLVFGSRAVINYDVLGPFGWVPWILPAIGGTMLANVWKKRYMEKFGDLPRAEPARV